MTRVVDGMLDLEASHAGNGRQPAVGGKYLDNELSRTVVDPEARRAA